MSLRPLVLGLIVLAAACEPAVDPEGPSIDEPGPLELDPEVATALQDVLEEARRAYGVPGLSAALLLPGTHPWSSAAGVSDLERSEPWTSSTRVKAASITKSLVAAALLQAEQDGALDRHDPVSDHVPGYSWGDDISLLQLLQHRSGLPDFVADSAWIDGSAQSWTAEELVALIADEPLLFEPGADYAYSNTNYVLASRVLDAVSGDWRSFVQQTCIEPAGATDTSLPAAGAPWSDDLARGYYGEFDVGELFSPDSIGAAGNLESTPLNLARWSDALWAGSLSDLGEAMADDPWPLGGDWSYGAGAVLIRRDGTTERGHNGVFGGFLSWTGHRPDLDASLAVVTNAYPDDGAGNYALDVATSTASELWAVLEDAQ